MEQTEKKGKQKSSLSHRILTIVGIVLCVILIPILIINCTLLIKGFVNDEEVPSIGGYFPMIVLTDSMVGEFDGGDLIFCETIDAKDVKIGDVITFYDPEGNGTSVVSHRVTDIVVADDGKIYFKTKGDNNPSEDMAHVPGDKLLGKYTDFHIPNAGHVAMFMQTTWGLIICVVVPLGLLIGYDAIRRKRYNKKHESDKDELMAELERLRAEAAEKTETKSADASEAPAEDNTSVESVKSEE